MFALVLSTSAFAYKDGTFHCPNKDGLPDNIYKVQTIKMGEASLPYIEIQRYLKFKDSEIKETSIRGFATVISGNLLNSEVLSIENLELRFDGERFLNCN